MWFEQAWAAIDHTLDQWATYIKESTNSLANSASKKMDDLWKSALKWSLWTSDALRSAWDSVKTNVNWAIESWKSAITQVVESWKSAITSVSNRVNSFQDAVNNWLAIIKKEWGQYIAEVKNDAWETVKMAMERTTATWKEVLANVGWKWQYVKDTAGDYADKANAIATVAYNNTLKWGVDAVKAWVNTAKTVYAEWKRQYKEELAKQKWETSFAAKWEWPQKTTWEKPKEHEVKSWDTLSKIALNEVGWDKSKAWEYLKKIMEANKWIDPNKIAIGQKISLPKMA